MGKGYNQNLSRGKKEQMSERCSTSLITEAINSKIKINLLFITDWYIFKKETGKLKCFTHIMVLDLAAEFGPL